LIRITIRLM